MKKLFSIIILSSLVLSLGFSASKKAKSNNIVLTAKNKFAIEGQELGSLEWTQEESSVGKKGEIIWNNDADDDWLHCGWELRGIDMSRYGGLKIELAAGQNQDVRIELLNPASTGTATFQIGSDGLAYVFFNGQGKSYGEMNTPDPEEGYEIRFIVEKKNNYAKTVIKNIELILQEDIPDSSSLNISEALFGSCLDKAHMFGQEITWPKNITDAFCGWNLSDIDLSDYDRIRVELDSNSIKDLTLVICEPDWENWHGFESIEPNIFEANLSGEKASWSHSEDSSFRFDTSEGLLIFLGFWHDKPLKNEEKTVVKSVQLLTGESSKNQNLELLGTAFGSSTWNALVYDDGIIEWGLDGKSKSAQTGWRLTDVDLSAYDKIRIEIESSDAQVDLRVSQHDKNDDDRRCDLYFKPVKPNILEASLDGKGYSAKWEEGGYKWDGTKRIDELEIHLDPIKAKGLKTKIKSVTLITKEDDAESKQPDDIMLNGAKLGSSREKAWVDDNFAISWDVSKSFYACCGWRVDSLEGELLVIKVSSTDVPLRLRIRDTANDNESSYVDDGTHMFVINLKTKKQQSKKAWKASEWNKKAKPFDFSQGGEIILEPYNGVFREGKKTVVEYIQVD